MDVNRLSPNRAVVAWALALLCATSLVGCGGKTCKRVAGDREAFLARAAQETGTHIEVTIPYAVANALIAPSLAKVDPIAVNVPGLGSLATAFGKIRLRPRAVALHKADGGLVGMRLDFDALVGGEGAFGLWVDTAFAPKVDLSSGVAEVGFAPDSLKKVVPHVTSDAAEKLGGIIYKSIPSVARALVARSAVDKAAGSVVEYLLKQFYAVSKDKLLPVLSETARLEISLAGVPVRDIDLKPNDGADGGLVLSIATSLPVAKGLEAEAPGAAPAADRISVRASADTLAELANWAMAEGLVPSRYNGKGKADEKGEYLAALEWVSGKRPLKIHLWQLEGMCKRVDMGADAAVAVEDGSLVIQATDGVIEGSEAAPFTELGVFFYSLWKDAVKTTMKRPAELKFSAGGQELVSRVEKAELADGAVTMTLSLERGKP